MASSTGAPTKFGATVVTTSAPAPDDGIGGIMPISDSPALTPMPSHEDLATEHHPLPPYSPFYDHSRPSFAQARSHESLHTPRPALNEKDLELGGVVSGNGASSLVAPDPVDPFSSRVHVNCENGAREDGMWPSKQTLLRDQLAEKKRRRERRGCRTCGPLADFWALRSKRERLVAKLLIALLVVGLAVTIGVCISIAVHGTVNIKPGQQQTIGVGK